MKYLLFRILLVLLCDIRIFVTAIEPGCANCGCCVDGECATTRVQGYNVPEYCTKGCIDGIGGNKCYNKCPDDCVTCEQTITNNCATCEEGKYVDKNSYYNKRCLDCLMGCASCTSSSNCQTCKDSYYITNYGCSLCHSRCKTCTSYTVCQECNAPYYNQGNTFDCSLSCPGNCVCSSTDGICSYCKAGFYGVANNCVNPCPVNCYSCSDLNNCQYCKDGYYNGMHISSSVQVTDCSLACRDNCVSCSSYDTCTACKPGHYGSVCQNSCSLGCWYSQCDQSDGICTCKTGFAGSQCNDCKPGGYGDLCDKWCLSSYCKDNTCDRKTGLCLSCTTDNIVGDRCDRCKIGWWGTLYCSTKCPDNCDGACDRIYGYCLSCVGNFQGNTCEDCKTGFHGANCSKECPTQCANNECQRSNGDCYSCNINFAGPTCELCIAGKYGPDCDISCRSYRCLNNACDRDTGYCTSCTKGWYGNECDLECSTGCKNNVCDLNSGKCQECHADYSGDQCCVKGGHCQNCSSNSACEVCAAGYFGETCDKPCPASCPTTGVDSGCEKAGGKCLSCEDGLHGDLCELTCSDKCLNSQCFQKGGHCKEGCSGDFEGPTCQQAIKQQSSVGAIAGGSAGAVAVLVIVGFIVLFVVRKRRSPSKRRSADVDNEDKELPPPKLPGPSSRRKHESNKPDFIGLEEDEDEGDALVVNVPDGQDALYENVVTVTRDGFEAYVRKKTEEEYKQEFAQLPRGLTKSHNDAKKEENVIKNRYTGIYPYDHSRVKIKGDPKFFFNACYIDGYQKKNLYIASLGPTAKATDKFNTFWKMVWHMDTDVIVMLTNLIEPSGNKCEQYWPNMGSTSVYNDITVSCQSVEIYAEYTLRTLTVEKKGEKRTVLQFHYTAWPDKSIPDEVTSLVEFRQRVRSAPRVHHGPMIIHCSAGIGRTGTYIALDRLTELGEAGGRINVYECVNQMRQQRVNMVQTLEQYAFLHKALVHTLAFKTEALRPEQLASFIRNTTDAEFNQNFNLLKNEIEDIKEDETLSRDKNSRRVDKNRNKSDIPADRHRPRIYICRTFNSSDYVNAVYIKGLKKKDQYIIAQSPLQETVYDFLCLVFQESCYCVVSMEDMDLIGTEIGDYLGADNQDLKCGSFTVKTSRCESKPSYLLRKLTISNNDKQYGGEKVVYHYQLTSWKKEQRVPSDVEGFTQIVKDVSKKADEMKDAHAPVLVHCLNAARRSALFCAVGLLIEKVEVEGQVSVPNTLRRIRARRRMAIPNKEQFEFCYRSVEAHVNSNNVYSNFP